MRSVARYLLDAFIPTRPEDSKRRWEAWEAASGVTAHLAALEARKKADSLRLYAGDVTHMEILKSIVSWRQYEEILEGLRGERRKYFVDALYKVYFCLIDTPEAGFRGRPGLSAVCAMRYVKGEDFYYVIDYDLGSRDGSQKPSTILCVEKRGVCDFRSECLRNLVGVFDPPLLDLDYEPELVSEVREHHDCAKSVSDDFFDSWGHVK